MQEAHDRGLHTFGMLCPLLPGVADAPEQIEELVSFLELCNVEAVFAEAVNQRGPGLKATEDSFRESGLNAVADPLARIRHAENWSVYVAELIRNLQFALRKHNMIEKLRFLLYPAKLQPADRVRIEADSIGVVWL